MAPDPKNLHVTVPPLQRNPWVSSSHPRALPSVGAGTWVGASLGKSGIIKPRCPPSQTSSEGARAAPIAALPLTSLRGPCASSSGRELRPRLVDWRGEGAGRRTEDNRRRLYQWRRTQRGLSVRGSSSTCRTVSRPRPRPRRTQTSHLPLPWGPPSLGRPSRFRTLPVNEPVCVLEGRCTEKVPWSTRPQSLRLSNNAQWGYHPHEIVSDKKQIFAEHKRLKNRVRKKEGGGGRGTEQCLTATPCGTRNETPCGRVGSYGYPATSK